MWRGRDALLTQDPANGAGRDLQAELAELALEAEIAPAGVLVGQLADQLLALFADRDDARRSPTSFGPARGAGGAAFPA